MAGLKINLQHKSATAMIQQLRNRKAQHLIEYAIVVALVSAAVAALSTYVFRSLQAKQKDITQEFTNE